MSKPIQSVERAIRMLEFLARAEGSAPLRAIANAADVRPSTAHNILATLVALGYVQRPTTGTDYRLGGRILNLARIAGDDDALRRRFRPLMEETARRFDESTYLIVPSGDELYYLDGIELPNNPTIHSRLGRREPLSGSAIGLVLAAFMPGVAQSLENEDQSSDLSEELHTVRQRGFAIEQGLYQPGLSCVAIPLRVRGEPVAGLCLNGTEQRLPRDRLVTIANAMADIAVSSLPAE
ncbi:IclR family transcriptional regulator [Stakelama sp. CBK3Z-3]|uniref:IclR family transcriptional regulator n=1 Tax=Stakelama flava TaxID=2860338 RepID=A0ABS6XS65_9SPHN|nr:IclR family transcriptional regulator [Stakelama flava]MBW4332314.1 IclR family transcriptional regulator [Stakelama flava]